ncbi:MAG: phytanoyl-CoA dioxygenase family protein [Armatimonadota bacterium]
MDLQVRKDLLPTEEDVRFYRENGYWLGPRILDDEALEALRDRHARVVAGDYATGRPPLSHTPPPGEPLDRIVKIDNAYWADPVVARLSTSPMLGAMAARLTGASGIRLWHDQLLLKPPDTGAQGNVGWHQDYGYWQCAEPADMLTAWVALDDVTLENGCMQVVPGSHKWGLVPEGSFFVQDLESLQAEMERQSGRRFELAQCILPAGAVSFHHCLTIHGSGPNVSGRPRRSIVVHMMPDGTRYRAGTPNDNHSSVRLLSGRDGDPYAGPFFPLIYREGSAETWTCWTAGESVHPAVAAAK